MKDFKAAFLYLHCRFKLFRGKEIGAKAARKMLVKLTLDGNKPMIYDFKYRVGYSKYTTCDYLRQVIVFFAAKQLYFRQLILISFVS